jgi:Zn-dependent M28 family amino/carboxypeptidase
VAGLSGEQPVTIGGSLYTIQNRNTENRNTGGGEGLQHATQYAFERFTASGLEASYHGWTTTHWTGRNVIGEQPGGVDPERIFLLVAHLDDYPLTTVAPGADDNASGSAAVLIAARLLSRFPCRRTLRFVLFTGEEQGLLGSNAYAGLVAGENIEGVLNLDMIGWESDGYPEVDLYARPGTADLRIAYSFVNVAEAYGLGLVPEVREEAMSRSDHASFWGRGFSAILAIEDFEDFNTSYHNENDRLAQLDLDYLTDFVKAAVGVVAHAACLAPGYVYLPVVNKGGFLR